MGYTKLSQQSGLLYLGNTNEMWRNVRHTRNLFVLATRCVCGSVLINTKLRQYDTEKRKRNTWWKWSGITYRRTVIRKWWEKRVPITHFNVVQLITVELLSVSFHFLSHHIPHTTNSLRFYPSTQPTHFKPCSSVHCASKL